MLVACRLAGLSALEGTMQASTSARNLGRRAMPSRPSASFPPRLYMGAMRRGGFLQRSPDAQAGGCPGL
jgi:hypothetical protein